MCGLRLSCDHRPALLHCPLVRRPLTNPGDPALNMRLALIQVGAFEACLDPVAHLDVGGAELGPCKSRAFGQRRLHKAEVAL